MSRERAYPGDKPLLCDFAWCSAGAWQTTTLRSGQVIRVCEQHAKALVPVACDCSFYLPGATSAVLRCNLSFGHAGDHMHPNSDLRWGAA